MYIFIHTQVSIFVNIYNLYMHTLDMYIYTYVAQPVHVRIRRNKRLQSEVLAGLADRDHRGGR